MFALLLTVILFKNGLSFLNKNIFDIPCMIEWIKCFWHSRYDGNILYVKMLTASRCSSVQFTINTTKWLDYGVCNVR